MRRRGAGQGKCNRAALAAVTLVALASACGPGGGGVRTMASRPGDVPSAGGTPHIARVVDLGAIRLPDVGPLPKPDSDGVFSIGELVLVEGSGFGRQPSLRIAGRPARLLGRLTSGAMIARVPAAVPSGAQPVEVVTSDGRATRAIPIIRYALIVAGDALAVVTVDDQTVKATGKTVALPGARFVRYSSDGSTAYVATHGAARARLTLVAMGAAGGPRVAGGIGVAPREPVALTTADQAPFAAVVGDAEVTLLATDLPHAPSPYAPWTLPHVAVAGPVIAAELSPDGKMLALLLGDQNRLLSVDVSSPESPRVVTTVDLLPGERAPLVRSMAFSADGETLWIVSGDNAASIAVSRFPTRVTAIKLTPSPDGSATKQVAMWRSAEVTGAGAPLGLALTRGQRLDSGTTVRIAPEKAPLYLSTAPSDALEHGVSAPPAGALLSTDVEGGGAPFAAPAAWVGPLDVSPDTRVLLASAARPQGAGFELGVVATPLGPSPGKSSFVGLGPLSTSLRPLGLGVIRIQP